MVDQEILKQNIISVLGIGSLSDDKKAALIDKMAELAEKRIILRLMQELPEKGHQEFEKIAEKGDQAKMEFLQEKFPNLAEIIQDEIVKVKKEVMAEAGKADQDLKELE